MLEPLAIGGMATIFKLEQVVHGGFFVAKLLHAELMHRPGVLESFRQEACHAAQIGGHPNAVPVFATGYVRGVPYITMPWIEGEDLDRLLAANGALSRAETLGMAAQISSLLAYAESLGITHCDLAPGNIRLDIFGRYRVLDLGISHSTGLPTAEANMRRGFIGGTPLYNSPEQIRGEVPDVRSDLYSLGCILCECLSGTPLFTATDLPQLREQHLNGDWHLPAEAEKDSPVRELLRRMLATRREDRMASAFELSGALAGMGFERPEFVRREFTRTQPVSPAVEQASRQDAAVASRRNRLS